MVVEHMVQDHLVLDLDGKLKPKSPKSICVIMCVCNVQTRSPVSV